MTHQPRKMSEIMKEMSERLLRQPDADHSSEAAHVALMFANIAWNETVGLVRARQSYRSAWESIEAENPEMWNEFKSNDVHWASLSKMHHRFNGCLRQKTLR